MSSEQKLMVDFILSTHPDSMTDKEKLRFASMTAAYVGVSYTEVRVVSVMAANSSRVRLELPRNGAEALVAGFQARDPRLFEFFAEVGGAKGVLRIEAASPDLATVGSTTDVSEKGLETLIFSSLTNFGWLAGAAKDYDRDYCVDLAHLRAFVEATQPKLAAAFELTQDTPARRAFLARLEKESGKRGVIDVLRDGVKHGPHDLTLFYGTPSPGNDKAAALYARNRFSVTRQLQYSRDETRRALDLCLFINGLPVATFELKNSLTKQTAEDAVEQYRRDRDPRERLFGFGRCVVHFAVDDSETRMCTELKGKASWFLPLNQGWNDGAGNPPNPNGLKTDYLWKRLLTPQSLTDILENYAQIVEEKNEKTGRKKRKQVFPRYHQLDVVRRLLADVAANGAGKRYLIQHSAGSGKSNSIAWLAHQLIGARKDGFSIQSSSSPTGASSTNKSATRSSNSLKSARRSGTPNAPATCADSSRAAKRSSSARFRSSHSSWKRSATNTASAALPS
jgi:type I restriction enzyme R subunit